MGNVTKHISIEAMNVNRSSTLHINVYCVIITSHHSLELGIRMEVKEETELCSYRVEKSY